RARVGRDWVPVSDQNRLPVVSIHAPAWGATVSLIRPFAPWCVSIHAPAWGATRVTSLTGTAVCGFQSTRPRGARPAGASGLVSGTEFQSTRPRGARLRHDNHSLLIHVVSIHAPAWGATGLGAAHPL